MRSLEELAEIFSPLWADIDPSEEFSNQSTLLLAHYTTMQNLENILVTNEIWLSNPLYMNDHEEMRFGMIRGDQTLRENEKHLADACGSKDRELLFWGFYNSRWETYSNEYTLDTYLTCFSEHDPANIDGRLSMWRAYGGDGNGVAIVFDTSKVQAKEESPLILAKVHYGTRDARQDWIREKVTQFTNLLKAANLADNELWYAGEAVINRLKAFALLTKHNGFEDEKEWRMVYFRERDGTDRLVPSLKYYAGPHGIEPKLKLSPQGPAGDDLPDRSFDSLIHSIIAGPGASSPLSVAALKRMLVCIGKPHLAEKVVPSGTPYRPKWWS